MTSGAVRDRDAGSVDPGIALLSRIGDFVVPLTRFGRGDIAMEGCRRETAHIVVRQTFRVRFAINQSDAPGPLPPGVITTADVAGTLRTAEAQRAAAQATAAERLSAWCADHGEDPRLQPEIPDLFDAPPPTGHAEACPACAGEGRIACATCGASGRTACTACQAQGSSACRTCERKGQLRCGRCYGLGYQLRDRKDGGQDRIPCSGCGGGGMVTCDACHGRGRIICTECHGEKQIACPACDGAGRQTCAACEGAGNHHHLARVSCAISAAVTFAPRPAPPEIAAVLATLTRLDLVLPQAEAHRATTEVSADTLTRETLAVIPVVTIDIAAGAGKAVVRAYGPDQTVRDYANIGGLLLADDLAALEAALPPPRRPWPARTTPAFDQALGHAMASPANISIAKDAARDLAGLTTSFLGAVSPDYIDRAAPVMKRAVRLAYWSELVRGPAAVLALPLLQLPLGLIVRDQPASSRLMVMLGVMLLAVGGAIAAHIWCVRRLRARLAPQGPGLAPLVQRLNLTRDWLAIAGAVAVLGTLVMAGLTSLLFPPAI